MNYSNIQCHNINIVVVGKLNSAGLGRLPLYMRVKNRSVEKQGKLRLKNSDVVVVGQPAN